MRKVLFSILFVFLISVIANAATIDRFVDPDATGAGTGTDTANAYTSLNAWEAAEQQDLDGGGNLMEVHCNSSAGTDDTTAVTIATWTTGTDTYIHMIVDQADRHAGIWDDSKYVLFDSSGSGAGAGALRIDEDFVRTEGLQIEVEITGAEGANALFITAAINASNDIRFSDLIIRMTGSSTGDVRGARFNDNGDTIIKMWNTIIYDFNLVGVFADRGTSCDLFNCTLYNNGDFGIFRSEGGASATNCVVFKNGDDFSGTITIDFCASDDNDGTNNVAESNVGADWTDDFTDAANKDFTLKSGSGLVGTGTDDPSPLFSDDITGTARTSIWDVGAHELVAAVGITVLRRRIEGR